MISQLTRDEYIQQQAKIELAKREFFYFCNVLSPNFYKKERDFLKGLCNELQEFYFDNDDVLVLNVPPRHGKSFTGSHLAQWIFGINPHEKIMTGSYNETLSTVFSKQVRNSINEEKAQENQVVYGDIFPNAKIKTGDAAMNMWSLEGQHNNYLATSPTGTATGFGASLLIIDDLIKNSGEANNDLVLEKHWEWFTNTMLSRLESRGKIIIIMTRWHSNDLAGRALRELPDLGYSLKHINMKAVQEDGSMLCEDILSKEDYDRRSKTMSAEIASANYQQEPMDLKGQLYSQIKTYDTPPTFEQIINYTDTADQGDDWLCSIVAGLYQGEAYILDVYYTKDGMEVTEPATADFLVRNNVNRAQIESNNGGRGFSRNVKRLIWERHNTRSVIVKWFHQSQNKRARILTNSGFVMEHMYFPENWRHRWPEFYKDLTTFQKEGKNKHDDAPDCLTGIAEQASKRGVGILK